MTHDADSTSFIKLLVSTSRTYHQVLLIVIGAAFLYLGSAVLLPPPWSTILASLGTSLIGASVVTLTWKRLGLQEERDELSDTVHVATRRALADLPGRGLGVVDISEDRLRQIDLPKMLKECRTAFFSFLYETAWQECGDEISDFLKRDKRNTLYVFLPDLSNPRHATDLAARHGMETAEFVQLSKSAKSFFRNNFAARGPQFEIRFIQPPGPSYSGYLFDPRPHPRTAGKPAKISRSAAVDKPCWAVVHMYKHRMTQGVSLPTITKTNGRYWDTVRADFEALLSASSPAPSSLRPEVSGSREAA